MPLGSSLLRTPDYLRNHVGLEHRVTALETGVHPTTADVDYFDSTVWTLMDIDRGDFDYQTDGLIQKLPYWRKRTGMVSLRGGIQARGGTGAIWPVFGSDGLPILATPLPKAARPGADMTFQVGITVTPWFMNMKVTKDGDCILFPAQWDAEDPGVACYFDGVMWIPGD